MARPDRLGPNPQPSGREHLLSAALHEFVDRGVAQVTVADIALRAGMAKAAVYYHFESKWELVRELVDSVSEEVNRSTTPRQPKQPTGPADLGLQVIRARRAFLLWCEANPEKARFYQVTSVFVSPEIEVVRRRHSGKVASRISEALIRARPDIARVEADVRALALITLLTDPPPNPTPDDDSVATPSVGYHSMFQALALCGVPPTDIARVLEREGL